MQIVFNVLASVKFNERLKNAMKINVLATKAMLEMASEMTKLKVGFPIPVIRISKEQEEQIEIVGS